MTASWPVRCSSSTEGRGTMAMPRPTSTARLIVSILSNSATRWTVTPCERRMRSVHAGSGCRARRERSPAPEGRSRQLLALGEGVAGWTDEDEPVAGERHDFEAAPALREGDHAEFDRAAQNVAHNARRPTVFEVYLGLRVARHKLADGRRQLVQSDAVDGRHAHRPAHRPRQLAHVLFELRVGAQDLSASLEEGIARGREVQVAPPTDALKEAALEPLFERAHLLADRRLCDEVAFRRLREALRLDQIAEDFKRFDLHSGY